MLQSINLCFKNIFENEVYIKCLKYLCASKALNKNIQNKYKHTLRKQHKKKPPKNIVSQYYLIVNNTCEMPITGKRTMLIKDLRTFL